MKKLPVVIILAVIGVLLVSGCTQNFQTNNSSLSGKAVTKSDSVENSKSIDSPEKPKAVLSLKDEKGGEVKPDSVVIDNKDQQATSRITIDGFEKGDHDIIVIVKGAKYKKPFVYNGESIDLIIEEPVKTSVFVLTKSGASLSGVSVYSDAELKCTTDSNGVCNFLESPGKHSIKLQAPGLFVEELKQVDKNSNSFTFKVERKFKLTVRVLDRDDTNKPIKGAIVKVSAQPAGETDSNGDVSPPELLEGTYVFEASYGAVSEKETKEINSQSQIITIYLSVPKTIVINAKDELDSTPLQDAEVWLEGQFRGKTDSSGKLEIKSVPNGDYNLRINVKYKTQDKIASEVSQTITVSSDKREFTVQLKAPKSITLTVIDEETNKTADQVKVRIGDKDGSTTQKGTIDFSDVLPGRHSINVYYKNSLDIKADILEIGKPNQYRVTVNMPNPELVVTMALNEIMFRPWKCEVELSNIGAEVSENPIALCFVYEIDGNNKTKKVDSVSIQFSNIAQGGRDKRGVDINLPWNPSVKREAVIFVYDRNPYTPADKKKQELMVSASQSLTNQIAGDVYNYCTSHVAECLNMAASKIGPKLLGLPL